MRYLPLRIATITWVLVAVVCGIGEATQSTSASTTQPVPQASFVAPLSGFSKDAINAELQRPLSEICDPLRQSLVDKYILYQYQQTTKEDPCVPTRKWGSIGVYGFQHPSTAFCGAGRAANTGLAGFLTGGGSVGTKNFLGALVVLVSMITGGCANQVVPSASPLPTASTGHT